jgi:hypothetical protein
VGVIDAILEEDNRTPTKQGHTAKRISEAQVHIFSNQFAPGMSIAIDQTVAFNLIKTVDADPRLSQKMQILFVSTSDCIFLAPLTRSTYSPAYSFGPMRPLSSCNAVRTAPFHGANAGSNPAGDAIFSMTYKFLDLPHLSLALHPE